MSTPNGRVYLCSNAIVDRTYNHTIDFKSPSEQLAYWGSLVKYTLTDFSYIRKGSRLLKVNKTLDELQDVNYLYFTSTEDSKIYYCFITSKDYVNDTTTAITFEIDVLQTRMFEYKLQQSYVVQEHVDRWDANHKPIYSRTDELLDYGSEYTVESAYKVKGDPHIRWFLAVLVNPGEIIGGGASGTATKIYGINNPYTMYLIPGADTGANLTVTYIDETGAVKSNAISDMSVFSALMGNSAMGKYVQQIIKLPYLPFNFKYQELDTGVFMIDVTPENNKVFFDVSEISSNNAEILPSGHVSHYLKIDHITYNYEFTKQLAELGIFTGIESALPTAEQWAEIIANPYTTERDKRFESKLLTYPYRYNLLTDWRNKPQLIKNEYIGGDKIKLDYTQGLTFNSPVRYFIEGYKKDPEGRGTSLVQQIPEEAPVINDEYYSYLLANKNQVYANQVSAMYSDVLGVATSTVSSAGGGNFIGAGLGAISGMFTATMNAANRMRNENAKQSDIKNLPDSILNPNDCAYNIMDDNEYVTLYRMKVCCEFEELLADTFATSGYTVKRLKVPNTRSRVRYNYVKTMGANIIGSFDQGELDIIRAIFDKGVTFWHYNTVNFKPFDYSLENIETKLIKKD